MAISLSFVLTPAFGDEVGPAKQGPSVPVQPDRTLQQSEQSRDQERGRGESAQINRNWKAQENADQTAADRDGSAGGTNEDHQTVGRDWRAHPERDENR
jgi:hypothetical protein